ncbi:tetratricopeptide repeat protein [Hyphomonas sp.]|uniref:tetratricopeptide repeat protein n=1 Tax=Hyphomonas sp. TaxID=87 RepID=UPI00391B80AA
MFLIAFAAGTALMMQSAGAELAKAEEARLEACVGKIEVDPENAYEDALAWSFEGNRPGARQCTALALIELGNYETGAQRLQMLANAADGGTLEQRAVYLSQAGQAWIMAGAPEEAAVSFTDALKLAPGTVDLLVDRASAYMMTEDWDKALSDLDLALANSPGFGPAHQLRAEVHLNKRSYDLAMRDVNAAMTADPKNIDTLLVRGRVREAMRVEAESGVAAPLD